MYFYTSSLPSEFSLYVVHFLQQKCPLRVIRDSTQAENPAVSSVNKWDVLISQENSADKEV